MLKKVKQKAYKSKRDFRDDLELIWSNCYKYNAAEDHPLRGCVDRLRVKAEKLLRYITDRKERTDPPIPNHQYHHHHQAGRAIPKVNGVKPLAKDAPFQETLALVRTPEGMASFLALDKGLSMGDEKVLEQLRSLTDPASPMDSSPRPSKRARLEEGEDEDTSQLWWNAVPGLVANGVPGISPSSSSPHKQRTVSVHTNPKSLLSVMNANIKTMKKVRGTHAKFAALAATTTTGGEEAALDGETGVGVGTGITTGFGGFTAGLAVEEDVLGEGDTIDERPWLARVEGKGKVVGRGKKKAKTKRKEEAFEGGIEIGEMNAHECITWMNEKVLEHVGFQGEFHLFSTSKLTLLLSCRHIGERVGCPGGFNMRVPAQCWSDDPIFGGPVCGEYDARGEFCVDEGWVVGGVEPHVSDSLCAIGRAGRLVFLVFSSHLPFGGKLSFFPLAPIFSPPLPFPF